MAKQDFVSTPVSITRVETNYGSWEEGVFSKFTTRSLRRVIVEFSATDPDVAAFWTRDLWSDDGTGSAWNLPIEGDPGFSVCLEKKGSSDGVENYKAELKILQETSSAHACKKWQGSYHLTLYANEGFYVTMQEVRAVLYKHINPNDVPFDVSEVKLNSCPPNVQELGTREMEINVSLTASVSPRLQVFRHQYKAETPKVTSERDHLYPPQCTPWMSGKLVPNVSVKENLQRSSDGKNTFAEYALTISGPSKEDVGEYVFEVSIGQQKIKIISHVVSSGKTVVSAGGNGILFSSSFSGGGDSVNETCRVGLTHEHGNWPDCLHATIFQPDIQTIQLLKKGVVVTSNDQLIFHKRKLRGRYEASVFAPVPCGDIAGDYVIQAVLADDTTIERGFSLQVSTRVKLQSLQHGWRDDKYCIRCIATGSPLPKVDFYRSHAFIADKPADGPLVGGEYEITQELQEDGSVAFTLTVTSSREDMRHAMFTCAANNVFTKDVQFARISMKP